jgi:hypothetical protein
MSKFATLTTARFELKYGTKNSWKFIDMDVTEIEREEYDNIVHASPFFRRLGGSETIVKGYTCAGYLPVRITSKSPDRTLKTVRTFSIISY